MVIISPCLWHPLARSGMIWFEAELAKIDAFLKDMRDLFDEVDVDGNGFVTRVELSQWPGMAGGGVVGPTAW